MTGNQENHINYEKWAELMSKEIFLHEEEKPKSHSKLYEMYGDDSEEEFADTQSKKMKF